jgi:hypothetical protein
VRAFVAVVAAAVLLALPAGAKKKQAVPGAGGATIAGPFAVELPDDTQRMVWEIVESASANVCVSVANTSRKEVVDVDVDGELASVLPGETIVLCNGAGFAALACQTSRCTATVRVDLL